MWFYDDCAKELEMKGLLSAYREKIWEPDNGKIFPFPGEAGLHPDAWVGKQAAEYIKSNTEPYLFT